ncbi:FecR family protein [Rhodocytophaga rosea]|uniref:FecR family protein n=1 Tax=Rhodocytophaga rosea TaxID=2704465 RepID=A0A6C0GBE3_9BACT|nr:FecR domain-containing protein [Rhodocytophaga rosea]QHT65198.1 FecR family protein [Rhodocytophaga rosea]
MNYDQYQLNDFLVDDYFIQWVKSPDPQTNSFWKQWLENHPEKKTLVAEARQLIIDLSIPGKLLSEKDKLQLWESINQRRKAHPFSGTNKSKIRTSKHLYINWLYKGAVAASVTVLLVLATWLIWGKLYDHSPLAHIHRTPYSQIKNITLPDGSQVVLNANSSLQYSSDWTDQKDREVQLTGEAFFDVVKKPGMANARFVVHTNGLMVVVLGTQFNVNNRRNKVEVVLQEGKVSLSKSGEIQTPVLMAPGDFIEYTQGTNQMHRKKVNPLLYSSWKEDEMIFEAKPLIEIAQILEDTKGIRVVFENDSLKKLSFTGTLPHQDMDNFFLVLSKSFGIEVIKQGNQIMFRNK